MHTRAQPSRPKPNPRRANLRGAAMVETVFLLPFVFLIILLLIFLGWQFRRMAQLTNMDRYAVWEQVTPGSPGPDIQRLEREDRNPRLNQAFFGLTSDQADQVDELFRNDGYMPQAHEDLRAQLSDETFSYFDHFITHNPRAIRERFVARHPHISETITEMGIDQDMRNGIGHSRLNGDWRYVNGIRRTSNGWQPGDYRVTPGSSLREVFFAEFDDNIERYDNESNPLAGAIRDFYRAYPGYRGPQVTD